VLAVFVEVLDGVDGKLARIKRMTSRSGELEHVLDFFYENSWYLALGFWLREQGVAWAWGAGIAMVAFDLADHLANLWFSRSRGRLLIETSAFLRSFRLVSGRRNIYVWMLLPGVAIGNAAGAFACVTAWAGFTLAVDVAFVAFESRRACRRPARDPTDAGRVLHAGAEPPG
jgi:phosphatidylglycerophosphate synthase